eukprot:3351913-Lingulodinium_polyedra.AAC.1
MQRARPSLVVQARRHERRCLKNRIGQARTSCYSRALAGSYATATPANARHAELQRGLPGKDWRPL